MKAVIDLRTSVNAALASAQPPLNLDTIVKEASIKIYNDFVSPQSTRQVNNPFRLTLDPELPGTLTYPLPLPFPQPFPNSTPTLILTMFFFASFLAIIPSNSYPSLSQINISAKVAKSIEDTIKKNPTDRSIFNGAYDETLVLIESNSYRYYPYP